MSATATNLIILFALIAVGWVLYKMLRIEHWQRAWVRLGRDRIGMISCAVIVLYMVIGLLHSILLPADIENGRNSSVLEWLFRGVPLEDTYSAPLVRPHSRVGICWARMHSAKTSCYKH
jgi:hypothetical protein